ncbi:NAD(P)-dependent oxidoreductase [Roseinatronobacter sp. S2]|uniref:NAD(P)-dependent oxidoreductase n=1 Tax=Roseinatronobacter sp. S2 TaxID=3035471 RepID=UPI00240EE932|nr:NAD(P)-dependent oxidoreductase [Roseinatronobacter sp. S2]WFE74798.1 NAD(P)-dependent oxidoreductase [Roseinatronobacter sp. S2]
MVNLSDATRNIINPETISLMKPTSIVVNLSRGEVIDQDALIAALNDGRIAGAGLGVTVSEPLPAGHPLWDATNVLITPHFSPPVADRRERSVDIIIQNLGRYRSGQPMLNQLMRDGIWTPEKT